MTNVHDVKQHALCTSKFMMGAIDKLHEAIAIVANVINYTTRVHELLRSSMHAHVKVQPAAVQQIYSQTLSGSTSLAVLNSL